MESNKIQQVEKTTFTEIKVQERKHLQEWIADNPNIFGEELLIIQKEFAGFDDTNERLDLLALDKNKNLVIIENKLDDSGKDAVWQALKYAGYCSNLDTKDIVKVFQNYLDKNCINEVKNQNRSAEQIISKFLDEEISEIQLNGVGTQRIILVAANYRKEVTNTMLWLLSQYGLDCQCFRVTPYIHEKDKFLTVDKILPPADSQEFMIGLAKKGIEEKISETEKTHAQVIRKEYWQYLLKKLKNSNLNIFDNVSATNEQWISAGSGFSGMPYSFIFGKKEIRVEMTILPSDEKKNVKVFNYLRNKNAEIENKFGCPLEWLELIGKKSCRIQYSCNIDAYDKNNWENISKWHIDHMIKFKESLTPHLRSAYNLIKVNSN